MNFKTSLKGLFAITLLTAGSAHAAGFSYQQVDYPGAVATGIYGIAGNNLSGFYETAAGVANGFTGVRSTRAATPTLVSYTYPGAVYTFLTGINALGDTTGFYSDALGGLNGFTVKAGVATPVSTPVFGSMVLFGINLQGDVTGLVAPNSGCLTAFSVITGSHVLFDDPAGDACPAATAMTEAHGINQARSIVGFYTGHGSVVGFLRSPTGRMSDIVVPGATATEPNAINTGGQIAGLYDDASGRHGFVLRDGTYVTLNVPGAVLTEAYGLNDAGVVVGDFLSASDGQYHGFIATPQGD